MSHFRAFTAGLFLLAFTTGMPALADEGAVKLKKVVEMEIKVKDQSGKMIIKRVPPKTVLPGDEVIFILRYTNNGKASADNVVINDIIPKHTLYNAGSAYGKDVQISFSVDNGSMFDTPENLIVKMPDGKERPANESDYTNVRWVLNKPLAPKGHGQVGFRAIVR